MARLFSIDVPFENQHYTALVSVKEQGSELCCVVRYIDKRVKHILSGDQLVFCMGNGLKQPNNLPSELARNLFISTKKALSDHLGHRA
jgi:hypothetical protein